MRLPLIGLLVLLAVAVSASASATPAERLAEAREAFRQGRYDQAIPLLTYLLYPDVRLSDRAELVEAHILLAVAHFESGARADARREVEEALFLDDTMTLDSLLFSDEAIAFFEERKQAFQERVQREAEARALAEERDRLRLALENMIVIERKPYYINFVPFGAGQFQNGQNKKGIFFFVSQALFGGASMGLWTWQVSTYGLNGAVPLDEVDRVFYVQQAQIATGAACIGLMVWGIIDSLIYYESTTQRPADESLLPDDFKPAGSPSSHILRRSPSSRPRFDLAPTPHGASAVMTWEF